MSGIWLFLLGFGLGGALLFSLVLTAYRRVSRLEEERQLAVQEKQIVVEFMHNMVEALGEGLSREELFQRIVHAAILSTGALSACVFELTARGTLRGVAVEGLFPPHRPLPERSKLKLTTRARFIEQILRSEEFSLEEGIAGEVARTRRAILIADAESDPRIIKHDDPALVVKSLIAAPITFGERLIGVLAVVNPSDGLPFNETDFSLVQSVAEQAGVAVHNLEFVNLQIEKRQIDLDLALASEIQRMLLPSSFPNVAGWQIDGRYRPAQKVGGDLYDLLMLPGGRLGIAVADVSGKGISGSLLMAICRTHLRQIAPRHNSPAAALDELNTALAEDIRGDMFITMLYGILDSDSGQVVFARAGHELPLISRIDHVTGRHRAEFLGSEGFPIGLVPPELFREALENCSHRLSPGDVLVMYTDGITETANDEGKEFSGSRLADVVGSLGAGSAAAINDGILDSIERFAGDAGQRDDLTLVTLKRAN